MASTPRKKDLSVPIVSENKKVIRSVSKKLTLEKSLIRNDKKGNSKKSTKTTAPVQRVPISLTQDTAVTETKIAINNGVKKKEKGKSVVAPSKVNRALLSPYRFPVPSEQLVSATARYAGVFLVVVGGFFSLLNLNFVNGDFAKFDSMSQKAELAGSLVDTDTSPTINTTQPEVQFVTLSNEPLHGTIEVKIRIDGATQISVSAVREGMEYPLGYMMRESATDAYWTYSWNTTQLQDGAYTLKVIVTGTFGSFEKADTTIYQVSNTTNTTITPINTSSTIATSSSGIQVPPSVSLQILEDAPVTGGVQLKVYVENAEEVKIYARNTITERGYLVGFATHKDENEWRITWDSTRVPDGNYELRAMAKVSGSLYESLRYSTTVNNVDESYTETTTVTTESASTTNNDDTIEIHTTKILEPKIQLHLSKESPLSNFVEVVIDVEGTAIEKVGLYAQSKNSLTPYVLGLAEKNSEHSWKYIWNTNQTPNGDYALFARIKTSYGNTDGERTSIHIQNQVVTQISETQETEINSLYKANDALVKIVVENEEDNTDDLPNDEQVKKPEIVYIQPVEDFMSTVDIEDEIHARVQELLTNFRKKLNTQLTEYAHAKRTGDEEALIRIKAEIEKSREEVMKTLPSGLEKMDLIDSINSYLSKISFELEELVIRNEKILNERIGDKIVKDSDKDNISDYDEVNVYLTDPFSADTDGDGYIDSAEITLGYNPHDSTSEAFVVYESPKDTGAVREDLFAINTITTLPRDTDAPQGEHVPRAIISGIGLPNSFVTLYIFSTPIVVTVKTDADGSWSYIFDKDLEDGEHEVYAAITDNSGRVIAKSNPLPFVKTAEAFTVTGAVTQAVDSSTFEPSLLKSKALLLVASIAVVALGLVLLLLGFHVKGKREDEIHTV